MRTRYGQISDYVKNIHRVNRVKSLVTPALNCSEICHKRAAAFFQHILEFCNQDCHHSTLGYLSPTTLLQTLDRTTGSARYVSTRTTGWKAENVGDFANSSSMEKTSNGEYSIA